MSQALSLRDFLRENNVVSSVSLELVLHSHTIQLRSGTLEALPALARRLKRKCSKLSIIGCKGWTKRIGEASW
jgi:hypothetical protein